MSNAAPPNAVGSTILSRTSTGIDGPLFNRLLIGATIVGTLSVAANLLLPTGSFLPAWLLIPQMLAFTAMLLMHIARTLGLRALAWYLLLMMAWEFLSEQVDIATMGGWYGAHFAYTDLWGPRFLGVPIVPPISIAVLVWPAFCVASMIVYGDYDVDHRKRSWASTLALSLVVGMCVSWMPVVYEAVCIRMGAYTYPQIEAGDVVGYWGSPLGTQSKSMPLGVFPGFTFLVMLQTITLTRLIGPRFVARDCAPRLHPIMDAAPLGFFFVLALGMAKAGSSVEAKIFASYSGVLLGFLALYAFYARAVRRV
jgi:hypothetical protein